MRSFLERIISLVDRREIKISEHGYDELINDDILIRDLIESIQEAQAVEFYSDFGKGPCILLLQSDSGKRPVHSVWGIIKGTESPAVMVTAYRPDPKKWSNDFLRRKK